MAELYRSSEALVAACRETQRIAPHELPPDLPEDPISAQPAWYPFEHEAWAVGEAIRRSFQAMPRLKRDTAALEAVADVVRCRNVRRGRQSFVMALGFTGAAHYSSMLIDHLDDPDIDGQILYTLLKMRAPGHAGRVAPFVGARQTWMRNLAKRYLRQYAPAV